jgi:hypothetical protein
MKVGALVLGIIGGLVALLYGVVGYGLGSVADAVDAGSGAWLKLLSVGLPIAALVGAGIVMAQPAIGATLMAVSALGFIWLMGFGFFSMIPVILLGLGALLGFLSLQEVSKVEGQVSRIE